MNPLPIRWKFALWAALLTGLTVVIFATGTLHNLYRNELADVDRELGDESREIVAALQTRGPADYFDADTRLGWVLFDPAGRVARADPRLTEAVARQAAAGRVQTLAGQGIRWRAGAFPVAAGQLVVGYDLAEVDELVADLITAYGLSLPLVALAAAFGGWWVAGRALQPVRALAAAAEAIQSDRLHRRLPLPAAADELQRLVVMLNAMLARLETSFEQAKRFAADASHELRTPLTIMRGEIEIMLRHPETPAGHEDKLLSLQEEIARLDRITEQLLLLARFDAGQVQTERQPVDFSSLVGEAGEDAELLAAARGVSLRREVAPGIRVLGDANQLRRLLLNLLDNAAKYNQPDGTVVCALSRHDGLAVLRVTNTGPGIPPELRPLVFQRFFRTGPSRATSHGHGLGLSLCREIALAHGGSLVLAASAPDLTEFRFTLPATG